MTAETPGLSIRISPDSVPETVDRLVRVLADRGITLFAVIDHSGEARAHGLELRETRVVIFGSPVAGTPVMQAAPLAALDLPLKVLVYDDHGVTRICHLAPEALAERYALPAELSARLAGISSIVAAAIAPRAAGP